MKLDDQHILVHGPLALGDVRVQMVVPPFSALLSNSSWKAFSDMCPIFSTVLYHDSSQDFIFFFSPSALGKVTAVVQFKPARVTLDLRFARKQLADTVP